MWWHSLLGGMSAGGVAWIVFGFVGQIMFTMRFITQWLASEKAKRTVVPLSFWIYSILGSVVLSIYAIYRKDPVFILGQLPSVFIYCRNIILERRNNVASAAEVKTMDS
ncbi:Lipid A Biosynthesis N-terminal domain-containing protein [Paenibacillus sp. UNC496MF]|uniref:lipid-A-disaccharide synthase N-terminal domain-containing protein n=1 Tax=Paenibacillus sp. UNC496MF TaxID=1502753 RepID=UPI0008E6D949|nr:lipid-A-disaccharide synthase N-terminal domain-containing protein [Paenibacillus sp. UNC496MF]SFJ83629.1 Lipid A Biosynthesis N-terminal domain-containing protein [Paenibacillus sp. UNC496MF]